MSQYLLNLRVEYGTRIADRREPGRSGDGPEEILTRERSALTTRLRAAAALRRGETVEPQEWSASRRFPGRIVIEERAGALATANEWRRRDTIWTDGSRLSSGEVGAARVWQ